MTKDEAREWLTLFQAFLDGKIIQIRHPEGWVDTSGPALSWSLDIQRIKPEPRKVTIAYEIHDKTRVGIHIKRDDWTYPSSWKFLEVELPE